MCVRAHVEAPRQSWVLLSGAVYLRDLEFTVGSGQAGQPASPRDVPVSASPVLELQAHTTGLSFFYTGCGVQLGSSPALYQLSHVLNHQAALRKQSRHVWQNTQRLRTVAPCFPAGVLDATGIRQVLWE